MARPSLRAIWGGECDGGRPGAVLGGGMRAELAGFAGFVEIGALRKPSGLVGVGVRKVRWTAV